MIGTVPRINKPNDSARYGLSLCAYAAFHRDFMRGKVTIVECPKLD